MVLVISQLGDQIENVKHPSDLVVCCVNADAPHNVHPNLLVGDNCEDGIYRVNIDPYSNGPIIIEYVLK